MGLSLVHGIITSHDGTIDVVHHEKPGTHFRICFPIKKPHLKENSTKTDDKKNSVQYRLLVVDDEPDVLDALTDTLIIQGHDVFAVASGKEALQALKNEQFDAILSDIRMPGIDGTALFSRIQTDFPFMIERTAFITGNDLSETTQQFLEECQRPFLGKPCSPEEISSLLADMNL